MKAQGFILVLASVALGAMSMAGCSSDPKDTGAGGAGGDSTTNTNTSSTTGGNGGNGGGSSSTSPTTVGSSSSTGGAAAVVGISCGTDSDCGSGLRCSKSTAVDPVFGGAIQGGYCTKDCTADTDCPDGSTCLPEGAAEGSPKQCLATCTPGGDFDLDFQHLDPSKCSARDDLACAETEDGSAICFPRCSPDGCDGSFVCDPRSGLCVEDGTQSTGLPTGAQCDKDDPQCAGICLILGEGDDAPTMCSETCVYGALDSQCGGLDKGVCLYATADSNAGDQAFCAAACTKHDDCQQNADWWCYSIVGGVPNGYCVNGTQECASDADCVNAEGKPSGQKCTETSLGKVCLDWKTDKSAPLFDLGARAPGTDPTGSGGGGAGGSGGGGAGGSGGGGAGGSDGGAD